MKETYDAVLVHGYTDTTGFSGNFDDRNRMQEDAAVALYNAGRVENIFLAGGSYWGTDNPTFGDVMAQHLEERGVDPDHIVVRPHTTTTNAEIDLFLDEARERGWHDLASQSTRTHTPRIAIRYFKKGRRDVDQVRAERVLFSVKDGDTFPHRDFLERFRGAEKVFKAREAFAITFELYGLGGLGQRFSDSRIGQIIKAKFDK